jgi:glycosyltransferase involved in cell wall biosynthesis
MSVLYLLTSPEPRIEGTDAVFQEVAALKEAVTGETINLNPRKRPGAPFPQQLYGFHKLPALWQAERRCRVNHLYFSVLHYFPVLRFLKNPVVYTVIASLTDRPKPTNIDRLNELHGVVVSSERDAAVLRSWGVSNGVVIPPAIEGAELKPQTLPLGSELTLLMASAPWVEAQFDTKGVDVLLEAVARNPSLKLILLWRGLLLAELKERIAKLGIGDRVEVVPGRVDIGDYLERAHAAVLLARRSDIVKAYPHSLIESLLAGKPVILTEALPMADYVRQLGCGLVAGGGDLSSFLGALEALRSRYGELSANARAIKARTFSVGAMIERYRTLYGL